MDKKGFADESEKQDFESFLLKYDLFAYEEVNSGINLLINYKNISFTNLDHIIQLVFLLPVLLILFLSVIAIIVAAIQYWRGYFAINPTNTKFIRACATLIIVLIGILAIFNYVYDYIKREIISMKSV